MKDFILENIQNQKQQVTFTQSFLMRKEKEDRCCGCVHGKELITFETGLVEPEKK